MEYLHDCVFEIIYIYFHNDNVSVPIYFFSNVLYCIRIVERSNEKCDYVRKPS